MFFGQVDSELVEDFSRIALQRAEQTAIAIHYDEAEFVVVC